MAVEGISSAQASDFMQLGSTFLERSVNLRCLGRQSGACK